MTKSQPSVKASQRQQMQAAYPVQLRQDDQNGEPYWVAELPDLPGCLADGDTAAEALESLEQAKRIWLKTALAEGRSVPPPSRYEGFSGRVLLRLPKSMHRRLAARAEMEDTSMNQLVVMLLSESLGLGQAGIQLGRRQMSYVAEPRATYSSG